jgi:hypothetical protein
MRIGEGGFGFYVSFNYMNKFAMFTVNYFTKIKRK